MNLSLFKSLLLAIVMLGNVSLFAQKPFYPGYVVTNSNDTIFGWIGQREGVNNPVSIKFKSSRTASDEREYSVNDIRFFAMQDWDMYERFNVDISMDPVSLGDVKPEIPPAVNKDMFLKVIQIGPSASL